MRYFHFTAIKSQQDKQRINKHPKLTKKQLDVLLNAPGERIITTDVTRQMSEKQNQTLFSETLNFIKLFLKKKKHPAFHLIKNVKERNNENHHQKIDSEIRIFNNVFSSIQDLAWTISIRENRNYNLKIAQEYANEIIRLNNYKQIIPKTKLVEITTIYDLTNDGLLQRIKDLTSLLDKLIVPLPLLNVELTKPGSEIGEGNKLDQRNACSDLAPNPKGLIFVCNWGLKSHITSIKNQGSRGTCTAFATVAAVETKISVKYNAKVNLSEQDLYYKQKTEWNPNIFDKDYGDGYLPPLSMLGQMLSRYVFPLEASWEYNSSLDRVDFPDEKKYTHSCDNYNGVACSDTNHQGNKTCYSITDTHLEEVVTEACRYIESNRILNILGGWVCDVVTEVIEVVDQYEVCVVDTDIPGTSGYKISNFDIIWDPFFDNDVNRAICALNAGHGLIYSFTVPDSFYSTNHPTDGNGYISYDENEKCPEDFMHKGHAVQIVAYIANEKLPPKLGITPGAGGGYFIIKNSWGNCPGDKGFYYAPVDWIKKWGSNMVAITDVIKVF